jgi:hypothetical protein
MIRPPDALSDTSRDVSADLNYWLNNRVPDGEIVELGVHRVERGVKLTDRRLTLVGGKLFHVDTDPVQYGVQLLKVRRGAVELHSVEIAGSWPGRDADGDGDNEPLQFFEWTGVRVNGALSFGMYDCDVHDVGGDFVYIGHGPDGEPSTNVDIIANNFTRCGRHGFVVNSAIDCDIANNIIRNVARWIVDIEPFSKDVVENFEFSDNLTGGGQHGFFHLSAGWRTPISNLRFERNTIDHRQMVVWVERNLLARRSGLSIADNTCIDVTRPYRGTHAMVRVGNWWSDVCVDRNSAYVKPEKALSLPSSAQAVDNTWIGD